MFQYGSNMLPCVKGNVRWQTVLGLVELFLAPQTMHRACAMRLV